MGSVTGYLGSTGADPVIRRSPGPRVDWPATYALRRRIAEDITILTKYVAESPTPENIEMLLKQVSNLDMLVRDE